MNRFLITGLPRSRTAWMAAFMTSGMTVCLHEPKDWRVIYGAEKTLRNHDAVGIADSGLGFELNEITEAYDPKILIIERPIEEVNKSLMALGTGLPSTNFCALLKEELDRWHGPNILRVPYHSLNDLRVMEKAFWHLTPYCDFDEGRFHCMKLVNIQVDMEKVMRERHLHNYKVPPLSLV